jgi:hypothetical protein
MNSQADDPEVTYFYEFIRILEEQYAWASVASVFEDIGHVRIYGPTVAGLEKRAGGVFVMRTPIGFGDFAFIEFEYDRDRVLQPVMGGFLKRRK